MSDTYRYQYVARPLPQVTRYRRWKCDICGHEMNAGGAGLRMHFEGHVDEGKVVIDRRYGPSWSTVITFRKRS